jgi:hypothetical protein
MSEFEDNLWLEVVRNHAGELVRAGRPARRHLRAVRSQALAGATVVLAGAAAAAVMLLGASTSPPAFAVTRNPDRTVTVRLARASGIAGANHKLAAMGVRAHIAADTKDPPALVCPGGAAPTITLDPASIPSGEEVVINPGAGAPGKGGDSAGSGAAVGSNHVVRLLPSGGSIRTQSGADNHVVRMYCR